jgi:hypothetical protein
LDPEGDKGPLVFAAVPSRTDNWDNEPTLDPTTGVLTVLPTNNDVIRKSSRMTFSVTDGIDLSELELLFNVRNVNDPPELTVRDTSLEVDQGETLRVQPMGKDIDPDDVLTYSTNFEEDLGTEQGTVMDQLPFFDPLKGVDWDIDTATGEVWFEPSSDEIWRDPSALLMERTISLVIQVKDRSGAIARVIVTVKLFKMDIWVPTTPSFTYSIEDEDPDTPGVQGLTIELSAGDIDRELYPGWVHSWDLGDGSRGAGRTVNHTYLQEGYRVITLRLIKDASASQPRFLNITLEAVKEKEVGPEPPGNGVGWTILVIAIVVGLVLLSLVVVVLVLKRRRADETAEMGHDRGAALGPGSERQHLRGQQPKDMLPPRSEPEGRCPKCGAQVRSGWFLCPSCKGPLT